MASWKIHLAGMLLYITIRVFGQVRTCERCSSCKYNNISLLVYTKLAIVMVYFQNNRDSISFVHNCYWKCNESLVLTIMKVLMILENTHIYQHIREGCIVYIVAFYNKAFVNVFM